MENQRQLLRDVFGESSDSEQDEPKVVDVDGDDEELCNLCSSPPIHSQSIDAERGFLPPPSVSNPNPNTNPSWCWQWQRIEAINGLWLCTDFLSPLQQSSLLSAIQNEGWFTELSHNQAMRFGDLPFWAVELSDCIREAVCAGDGETDNGVLKRGNDACILPSELLWRDPFFDQLIVNMYQPGEGICAHIDLMRFDDGIAIVSLESPCIMHFSPVQEDGQEVAQETKVPVYLNPGSLVIMWGMPATVGSMRLIGSQGFRFGMVRTLTRKGEPLLLSGSSAFLSSPTECISSIRRQVQLYRGALHAICRTNSTLARAFVLIELKLSIANSETLQGALSANKGQLELGHIYSPTVRLVMGLLLLRYCYPLYSAQLQ